jgi:4,5-DOPA dioxygenase extradiol
MSMRYFGTDKESFVFDWTKEFDEYVKKKIDERDFQSLIDYEKEGSAAKLSVPTMDHYAPLMYSLAMADKNEEIKYTYEELLSGAISMRCLQIGN